jgi:DNA-binding GntR family transcriptional regulator
MSLTKKAYSVIKAKILSCEYPPDTFLNEAVLMAEIGASRTPIREAMTKLEHENLVRIVPKKGVLVTGISLGEIKEVYQVRELLEPHIIRVWGKNVDHQVLVAYRESLESYDPDLPEETKFQLDNQLHRLIFDNCENKYFVQLLDTVYDQTNRIRIISGKQIRRRLEDTRVEHLAIVDRFLANDIEGAATAMSVHLENSKKAAFELLLKVPL